MFHRQNSSHGRGSGTNDGNADLHRGQQPVGISLEMLHNPGSYIILGHQTGDPALPDGDDGEFGQGKEAVYGDENGDEDQFQGYRIHAVSPDGMLDSASTVRSR